MKAIPPYDSINLTKGKAYEVLKNNNFGDITIKNDAGTEISVNTTSSVWVYGCPWRLVP
jgi:hypothetical protein